ncbi:MAG TPA: acetyl-CoA hydrolase/transferase C-terminal domain-containing protein, partial [Polyangia bacterium]
EDKALLSRIMPVEEAVKLIKNRMTLGVSGFTKSGEPKTFFPALARHFAAHDPEARVNVYSGASLSDEVENPLAPFIRKRGPYISSTASRKLVHSGKIEFTDIHLSLFARNLLYGFYGDIDYAVVEATKITRDGLILTSSVGVVPEAVAKAKKVIVEINTQSPDWTGFHDIVALRTYPESSWPIPLINVHDHVGTPYVRCDPSKIVAIVESKLPDWPVPFKPVSATDKQIALNVIQFLDQMNHVLGWKDRLPPIQSGVGNIANAIVGELFDSKFKKIRFWTEVFQDGMLRFMDDDEKFAQASATAVSFSQAGYDKFFQMFDRARERLTLRPMSISNMAELITRLFVVAMNTPVEVDIYGHANSTHVDGTRIINGLGGSGDFLRNAYVSIVHTPSAKRLRDGSVVSCIMPYLRHVDHTEHDIKCIVTEQGYAVMTEIMNPEKRAQLIIDNCAHPHFRPLLHDYLKRSNTGTHEPRITSQDELLSWRKAYDDCCTSFTDAGVGSD